MKFVIGAAFTAAIVATIWLYGAKAFAVAVDLDVFEKELIRHFVLLD